jgi:L-fucose isomerase-like protein
VELKRGILPQNYNNAAHKLYVTQMTILLQLRIKALMANKGYNHGVIAVVRDARPYRVNRFTYFLKKACRGPNNCEALAPDHCAEDSDGRIKDEIRLLWH